MSGGGVRLPRNSSLKAGTCQWTNLVPSGTGTECLSRTRILRRSSASSGTVSLSGLRPSALTSSRSVGTRSFITSWLAASGAEEFQLPGEYGGLVQSSGLVTILSHLPWNLAWTERNREQEFWLSRGARYSRPGLWLCAHKQTRQACPSSRLGAAVGEWRRRQRKAQRGVRSARWRQGCSKVGPSPVQGRNPKPEGRKKSEIRSPESTGTAATWQPIGSNHCQIPGFGLLSAFGLRASDFRAAARLYSSPGGGGVRPNAHLPERAGALKMHATDHAYMKLQSQTPTRLVELP